MKSTIEIEKERNSSEFRSFRLIPDQVIESTECSCCTRSHRDDDLFIRAIRAVACSENAWYVRCAVAIDLDFTELVTAHRFTEPVRVRYETDLDEDTFELNVTFDVRFALDIRDPVYFIRSCDFLRLCVDDDRDVRKRSEAFLKNSIRF